MPVLGMGWYGASVSSEMRFPSRIRWGSVGSLTRWGGSRENVTVAVSGWMAFVLGTEEVESLPSPVSLSVLVLHSHKQTEFCPSFRGFL